METRESRTKNSSKNAVFGLIGQILVLIAEFVARTIFIYCLGKEYLGISGLFQNILTILSISELGIGTAVTYALYEPLAQEDKRKICALMSFFKKAYWVVGTAVLMIGIILLPLLPKLMKGTTDLININFYYALYLAQSVLTYWFGAYKEILLVADQKRYVSDTCRYIVRIIRVTLQCMVLLMFHTFFMYTVIAVISSVAGNIWIAIIVDKKYPYLKNKKEKLEQYDKKNIGKNVAALSLYKVSGTVVTSTDSLVMSAFIGTATVGVYSNYLLIINTINTLVNTLIHAFTSSVGDLNAVHDTEKNEKVFRGLVFISFCLSNFCTVCLLVLLNPFIEIWLGKDYIFSYSIVIILCINFLTAMLQSTVILYKDACGLFWKGKLRPVASAILNLGLSIVLVKKLGVAGIILGTIISRFLTTWWFDAYLVHKNVLNKSPWSYYFTYIRNFIIVMGSGLVLDFICGFLPYSLKINFVIRLFLCLWVPNLIILVLFHKSEEWNYILDKIKVLKIRRG